MLLCMEPTKKVRKAQVADKYVVRLPEGMREKIAAIAKANKRSMNAEMCLLLQEAINSRTAAATNGIDMEALADLVASKVAVKLTAQES